MTDIRQTAEYAKYMRGIGWEAEKINGTYFFIKRFPLIGNFVKIQRSEKVLGADDIKILRDKHKIFRIVIEPSSMDNGLWLMDNGFKQTAPYAPSITQELDLTLSQKKIYDQLKKDCRYALRKTENIKIIEGKNIDEYRKNWRISVPFSRYVPSLKNLKALKKSFGRNCILLEAGRPAETSVKAGAVFLMSKDIGYYWFAFTNKEGRRKLIQYKILWEGILWAKRKGVKKFDFEGIYDARFPNKKWLGFTHFKKSFGGKEVEYPGALSKWKIL